MNQGLYQVGVLAFAIGLILLLLGIGDKLTIKTRFGNYSGSVGAVLLALGIVLMAISSM